MIYFDTSYLVRLYYADPGADAVRAVAGTDNIACAAHGQVEMIAAFHRKLREGYQAAAYAALLCQLRPHDEAGAFQWLAQGPEIYAHIAKVYAKLPSTVYLRAADAIHLATAAEAGFKVIYSNAPLACSGKAIRHCGQKRYPVAGTNSPNRAVSEMAMFRQLTQPTNRPSP